MMLTDDIPLSSDWEYAFESFKEAGRQAQRYRYSTVRAHVSHMRTLARVVPAGPADVTSHDMEAWLESRGRSRQNGWQAARSFFGWAVRCGLVPESPVHAPKPRRARSIPGKPTNPAWSEALDDYTQHLAAGGRAARTIDTYLAYLRRLAQRYADPWAVTDADLARWLAEASDWMPETRRAARVAVRGFYAHGVARGKVAISPAAGLMAIKVPRGVPRPTPPSALHAALMDADDRGGLMILLGAYAGLRAAEIAQVRPSTDIQDGLLYVTGKGGHQRVVPVHPFITDVLESEMTRRQAGTIGTGFAHGCHDVITADSYLFPSSSGGHITPGHVSVLLGRLLPGHWTAHTLRHSFASRMHAEGVGIRTIQELLGHASIATTQRYTAVPTGHLVAAVMSLK